MFKNILVISLLLIAVNSFSQNGKSFKISGTVMDGNSGAPISNCLIELSDFKNSEFRVLSDSNGHYLLDSIPIENTQVNIVASKTSYFSLKKRLVFQKSSTDTSVIFSLTPLPTQQEYTPEICFQYRNEATDFVKSHVRLLDSAYINDLESLKIQFFDEWYDISREKGKENKESDFFTKLNTMIALLYEVDTIPYKQLFPFPDANGEFHKAKFFVVTSGFYFLVYPDSIFNSVHSFRAKERITDTLLKTFFPVVNYQDKKLLYLTDEYWLILETFLYCDHEFSSKNRLDSLSRRNFLKPELEISRGHDDYYHIETFPSVNYVESNEAGTKVRINFRSTWREGGHALFEKQGLKWIMIEYTPRRWVQ